MLRVVRSLFPAILLISLGCLLLIQPALAATTDELVVEATGSAPLSDGSMALARDMATSDALRNAVEKALGSYVDSKTYVSNFQLIEDSVLTRARGYIAGYETVDEYTKDGEMHVVVKAKVRSNDMEHDVATLDFASRRAGDPRILVLLVESYAGNRLSDSPASAELTRKLIQAGLKMVETPGLKPVDAVLKGISGDTQEVCNMAYNLGADLVIIGEATCEKTGYRAGWTSTGVKLVAKVVRTDTAQVVTAISTDAVAADVGEMMSARKALSSAGTKTADNLIAPLAKSLEDNARSVQLVITQVTFTKLKDVERFLRSLNLVSDVNIKEFSSTATKIDVKTSLLPMQLADLITRKDGPGLEVTGVTGAKLECRVNR